MRVLIADDHQVIRGRVRVILSYDLDIELFEAANGQEAINKTLELSPDLVILDLSMPVMGGYAAAQELRRLAPKIPILFFSIHEGTQLVKEVKAAGARGFLHKSKASVLLLEAVYELVLRRGTFFPGNELDYVS
jgi:DNA-binding NarL/FixJ family response regulator